MRATDGTFTVYMHKNKINGKRYVGITKYADPNERWKNGRGYYRNKHFFDSILKYGWDNFDHEIVTKCLSREEAEQMEIDLIRKLDLCNKEKGYNINSGGKYFSHSEESRALMSKNRKGKGRVKRSAETCRKISEHHGGGAEKKSVRCVETGETFESIQAAAKSKGLSKKIVSNCCRKVVHYNTAGGYHWELV